MRSSEGNQRIVAGRYRLDARLGAGGMGTVWRAFDQLLSRDVAVKEVQCADGPLRNRTLREARAVARIKHPHVIVVHDVVEEEGRPWIVMELVDGRSLGDRLRAEGPLGVEEAARVGVALLDALRVAHGRGVLHRDIKPDNVLMESGDGRVILTDFGIAQLAGATRLTETGAFVGTPEYTAPERMAGRGDGPEADLWSVGALLWALVSGESPFRRDALGAVVHAVAYEEVRVPEALGRLRPVVEGLLERDPGKRLGVDQARALLGGEQVVARPQRIRKAVLAAMAVVTLAGAGGGVAAFLVGSDGETVAAGDPTTRSPRASAPESGSAAAAPTMTVTENQTATATATATAPSGYEVVRDPAGFTLAVPEGFTRSYEPPRVFYYSPGKEFRLGVRVRKTPAGGPLGVMRESDADGPDSYPGYRQGTVTDTVHNGHPAALWEFTWNGFSKQEGTRHTFDLGWDENGTLYSVWVSSPVGKQAQAKRHFDTALATFSASGS